MLLTAATTQDDLENMIRQRVQGIPLELIVGWAEFAGLRIGIEPGVLFPRQRTPLLLRHNIRLAPAPPQNVELC